jgi:hypothetical protein
MTQNNNPVSPANAACPKSVKLLFRRARYQATQKLNFSREAPWTAQARLRFRSGDTSPVHRLLHSPPRSNPCRSAFIGGSTPSGFPARPCVADAPFTLYCERFTLRSPSFTLSRKPHRANHISAAQRLPQQPRRFVHTIHTISLGGPFPFTLPTLESATRRTEKLWHRTSHLVCVPALFLYAGKNLRGMENVKVWVRTLWRHYERKLIRTPIPHFYDASA